ncbi:acetyl-CoA carboxylase biotin carboxyl carrier protein [Lactobacillus alvi]|uniref:Biotin carboxyl carrier protein of acetyl-CoA carboxylase n=1 Tax=Limosilactobacillus alvi TaxID=990412 RepID=A0ABS2EMN1_9LACO|nr:acetyl-CoA carboxylase biotin carboxyl carrier protein [Limosilactobacillus alvi]MBM6753699.1 acetyl-CoA carboxylase biotin carboxyl carrier protein [Limosilactobacillus alvi]
MQAETLEKIIQAFEDGDTREFELNDGDFHLYLSKNKHVRPKEAKVSEAPTMPAAMPTQPAAQSAQPTTHSIMAPLVGTVYLQPKPGAKPYVQVGDQVKVGQVVCVIEAMKMMTEVKSKINGTVKQIAVEDEQLVEVDQPLFEIEPA